MRYEGCFLDNLADIIIIIYFSCILRSDKFKYEFKAQHYQLFLEVNWKLRLTLTAVKIVTFKMTDDR